MYEITDKAVLVTGSTAGLGRQLAITLLREGAKVMINGRDQIKLSETMQLLKDYGEKVASVQGDVSSPQECRNIVEECIRVFGRLDILINNAGKGGTGSFRDTVPEAAKKVIETNLFGSIYPTHYALPHILEARGTILFISSLAGIYGLPYSYTYSASKMALTAMAQALRIELSGTGVHTGIMYVGFLRNAPEKTIIGNNGIPVHTIRRPTRYTMTMEKASNKIIRAIRKRQPVKVFSFVGKLLYYFCRISPLIVRKILATSSKKMKYAYTPVELER